jgi:hypothetical protein
VSMTKSDMLGNYISGFEKKAYQGSLTKSDSRPKQGDTMLQRTISRQGPQVSEITKWVDRNKFNFNSRESTGSTGVT